MAESDALLPREPEGVLKLATRSMFELLAQAAQGMLVVDRDHRIVWISEGYKRFLPALGFDDPAQFVGRRVEEVIPNTQLGEVIEHGRAILLDLLTNRAGSFLVSRLPLRDEAGRVIGALGLVLLDHPETTMQPLVAKFAQLQRALEQAQRRLAEQRRTKYTIASFIGSSAAALEVKRQARRVAATDATVLLLGETGTGKELLAQAIHAASPRAARAFVSVNIAAVPDGLLEAEFFGVAPGAFTGADRRARDGKFALADGGTLFLDEIGDMPLGLQAKLLRVLQEQEVEPLGSNQVRRVDVRVIAATSRDLSAMVGQGQFRADLYYRLSVLPIRVPPLRERLADVEALAETLLEDIGRRSGLPSKALSAAALECLLGHAWPGNIRELRNALEQAALMTDDAVLGPVHLGTLSRLAAPRTQPAPPGGPAPAPIPAPAAMPLSPADEAEPVSLPQRVAELERLAIADALRRTAGNRLAAARLLGISRASLYDRLARWPGLSEVAGPAAGAGRDRDRPV